MGASEPGIIGAGPYFAEVVVVRALALGVLVLLSACGGGGGGSSPPPAPPQPVPPLSENCESGSVARLSSEPLQVGRSAELHLLSCGPVLRQLQWTQTAGPALVLSSARSPSLSFTPAEAGSYRFGVAFVDAQGRSHSGSVELAAAPAAVGPALLTRGEPSVWGGGRLSLRAWPQGLSASQLAGASWRWERVSGPTVDLGTADAERVIFNAPSVGSDQLLVLRATLSLGDGSQLQDQFRLLLQPPPNPAASPLFSGSSAATRVYPYLASGPHAAALERCVYHPGLQWNPNNLCTLGELPLLGQGGVAPTVEQVMQRVLVSNDWMGEVFERFLREQDSSGDLRRMLASTTAVVIGGRIRPSFYWSTTGAIYLDAGYLWLTPEQRDSVSEAPDPRSANGPLLQYAMPYRYVKDNDYATPARPVAERATRPLDEIRVELGRLLYHELAHAADFVPPRIHAALNPGRKVFESTPSNTPSELLRAQYPFRSQQMVELGRVLFFGETATSEQNAYQPADIVGFFSTDIVNDDYAYSWPRDAATPREDIAMLIEEAMVQLRFGVLRDIAVSNKLVEGASSADLIVSWGQRGRIGDAALRNRLRLALTELMPWVDPALLANLAAPRPLQAGLTWGQNLNLSAAQAGRPRVLSSAQRARETELMVERRQRQSVPR